MYQARFSVRACALAAAVILCGVNSGQAQLQGPVFKLTHIGTPSGTGNGRVGHVNQLGHVVGNSDLNDANPDAVRWTDDGDLVTQPGEFLVLGALPGGTSSRAASLVPPTLGGVNAAGDVTGFANGTGAGSFRWTDFNVNNAVDPGEFIALGALPNDVGSYGYDISDAGEVVGFSTSNTVTLEDSHAFFWRDFNNNKVSDPGEMVDLHLASYAGTTTRSLATGIDRNKDLLNVNQQPTVQVSVLTTFDNSTTTGTPGRHSGYFWSDIDDDGMVNEATEITYIPMPAGLTSGELYDVNNQGEVVGWLNGNWDHTVLWNPATGVVNYLGGSGIYDQQDQNGRALAINDSLTDDFVVGTNQAGAFLYAPLIANHLSTPTVPVAAKLDLNDHGLVTNTAGWDLVSAIDISNSMQIVGHGTLNGNSADFLLTPYPGDANLDGETNNKDYLVWANWWGTSEYATFTEADFNGDGAVNGNDYVIWATNWGHSWADPAGTAVPEPASIVGGILGSCLIALRRRRI